MARQVVAEGAPVRASAFKSGHGVGEDWGSAVKACMNSLEAPPVGANLGLLYATDALAGDLSRVLAFLRERTRIEHWVGNIGFGVAASGVEYHDRPALSVLTAALPEAAFRIIFRSNLKTHEAFAKVREELPESKDAEKMVAFLEKSERGFSRRK